MRKECDLLKKKVLKPVSETVKSEAKEQKGGFLASYWVH